MKRKDIIKTINSLSGATGHEKIIAEYNSQKPLPRGYKLKATDPWCAATVSAVFLMNNYHDFSECSCPQMIEKAKKLGLWVEDDAFTPQAGDIIMYDWQDSGKGDNTGVADHVGIVTAVIGNSIHVREGNKGGTIGNRVLKINDRYIRGYIVPIYNEAQKPSESKKKGKTDILSPKQEKPEYEASASSQRYSVGKVYTISVRTSLNVRIGAGINYPLVGYNKLTADGKKHAYYNGALKSGTRVTCLEIKETEKSIWMRIPSGWICAVDNGRVYIV